MKKPIAALVGMLFLVVLLFTFNGTVSTYETFVSARSVPGSHVIGYWVEDRPLSYDRKDNKLSFYMEDQEGNINKVIYYGLKPDNFEEAEKLVIRGQFEDNVFIANHILVKCPSKYNDQQPE
jgi:cytochrome c-type biogenesis protein CcmE